MIPTHDFDVESGMDLIIDEIKTFNTGFTPVGTPYWLTSPTNRQAQLAGSIMVSFPTEGQAKRAIKDRLYIAGMLARVRKYYPTASIIQYTKCGGFRHLYNLCKKREYKCLLCSEAHATEQHHCSICKLKGKKCLHLTPKCINCKGTHASTDLAKCEFFQALKNKVPTQDQPTAGNTTTTL